MTLARADRLEGRAKGVAGSCLDLDDEQRAAAPAYKVELAAACAKTRADDLKAARPQEIGRSFLAGPT
jgi:hypothetical protein